MNYRILLSVLALILACGTLTLPARADYGALAAGMYLGNPRHVATGVASSPISQEDANAKALQYCHDSGIRTKCKVVMTFSGAGSCGFIAAGKGYDGNGRVGWGMGITKEVATANCRKYVRFCREPLGGCTVD